jgi:ppGpp synthetase/RelA/SpoT-type nucleotidyltranferase
MDDLDLEPGRTIDISNYETFMSHPVLKDLEQKFEKQRILAKRAIIKLINDLKEIDSKYYTDNKRAIFTRVEGRAKENFSFFNKLRSWCEENAPTKGITETIVKETYSEIKDLCGVRFACPYYDDVEYAIENLIRPGLIKRGYAVDLRKIPGYEDKNTLYAGNEEGYRSYHFYVRIPTQISIYGDEEMCLCEIQGRTELQHAWADKSHNLFYKPDAGWGKPDDLVKSDMQAISLSLSTADQFLMSVRKRVRKEE